MDHHVEAGEFADGSRHAGVDVVPTRHIGLDADAGDAALAYFSRDRFAGLGATSRDHDRGARRREGERHAAADTLSGTGDDGDASVEWLHTIHPPPSALSVAPVRK